VFSQRTLAFSVLVKPYGSRLYAEMRSPIIKSTSFTYIFVFRAFYTTRLILTWKSRN
jgi:hypothetical protein